MSTDPSDPLHGGGQAVSKPAAKNALVSLTAEAVLARPQSAPVVPAQAANVARSATTGNTSMLGNTLEAIVAAGLIGTIGLPANASHRVVNQENNNNALAVALEAFSKTLLNNVVDASVLVVPITSLSDSSLGQGNLITSANSPIHTETFVPVVVPISSAAALPFQLPLIVDTSIQLGSDVATPLVVTTISGNTLTVVDAASSDVQVINLVAPVASIGNFINTGVGTLIINASATQFTSISLTGNVTFTTTDNQSSTGITISALGDTGNVALYLHGNASNQNSTDFITLGNGNDFVLDTGTGNVLINLGTGQNTVMLVGTGVTGIVNFATHDKSIADFVTLASNGLSDPAKLAANNFVTIGGFNNEVNGSDALAFLGDMSAQLVWANGGASRAQVTNVIGDPSNLTSWISAAQSHASSAHSVAWFQFAGDTYILETPVGIIGNHAGDTLVKLSGLTQFSGADGQLTIGMLHFVG